MEGSPNEPVCCQNVHVGYDIVGDIHGHAEKLAALLRKLGYRHHLGAWRHPDRSAIFVGDFIDRGPGQLETMRIVREMLDTGAGQAVMGNHEFNAIAWYTPDPEFDGQHLRRRIPKNRQQHQAFLAETENDLALHTELVGWFRESPPVAGPSRPARGSCLLARRLHGGDRALSQAGAKTRSRASSSRPAAGSMEFRTIEALTKGLELALAAGHEFYDKDGHRRDNVRVRWWDRAANTYRNAAIIDPTAREALPDTPVPESALLRYSSDTAVFCHYWWTVALETAVAPSCVYGLQRRKGRTVGRISLGG